MTLGDRPDDIAIIGWSISPMVRYTDKTETQLLLEVVSGAVEDVGITRADVDFTCAGGTGVCWRCGGWVSWGWGCCS